MVLSSIKIGKHIIKFTLFLILLSLSAVCRSKKIELKPLPDAADEKVYDKKWEKYGAYYDKYDVIITSKLKMGDMNATFEIFKKIKILTTEGTRYGTVPVYKYAKKIKLFEPHLYDPNGNEIPLPVKKLKKDYIKSGKVVFPRVTAGSVITLRIIFLRNNVYYTRWKQWFDYSIPARISRFVFAHTKFGEYEYKTYGTRCKFKEEKHSNKHYTAHVFFLPDYKPRKDIDYLDYRTITEPRVIFRLTNLHFHFYTKHDLDKRIIKDYTKEIDETSLSIMGNTLEETVKKIVADFPDTLERAKKIVLWVQDKVASRRYKKYKKVTTFTLENASNLKIASICYKMLKRAGLKPKVLLAFDKYTHILDSTFLFFSRDICGFPVLTIHGKTYVAYPYEVGYELGEYPLRYNGALCLDLQDKTIHPLPPPLWGEKWISDRVVLDLNSFPGNYTLIREFKKNSASDYRNDFLNMNKVKQREKLEDIVKYYKKSNTIESFSFQNLDVYGKSLLTIVTFKNDDMPITYGNKKVFKLNNFFYDYFEDITPRRTEDVFIHNKTTFIDELEILKITDKKITPNIEAKNLNNKLFSVEFNKSETDTSYIFQRILTFNKNHIPKKEIKNIYHDCVELNKIKNSSITIVDK